jgi:hypothetical protein
METPHGASGRGGTRSGARSTEVGQGNALRWPQRAAQEKSFGLCDCFPHPMLT